jgi:RNA polymerase sigma factor (TIGR02999 family)
MDEPAPHEVTQILVALGAGDKAAAAELLPLVYDELRKLAHARMGKERQALTLEPTALVHEAYLRVIGRKDDKRWENRGHFFAAAAQAMRRILVERARHHGRVRHGGGRGRVALDDNAAATNADDTDLVALDEAMTKLEAVDPRKAQVVVLRYFGGLTVEETAAAMDLSPATIKNEWSFARAWLHREIARSEKEETGSP